MELQTTTYDQGIILNNYGVLPLGFFSWVKEKNAKPELPPLLVQTSTIGNDTIVYDCNVYPAFTLCEILNLLGKFLFYIDSDFNNLNTVFKKLTQNIYETDGFLETINNKLLNLHNQ
jgi:hypothetical protein